MFQWLETEENWRILKLISWNRETKQKLRRYPSDKYTVSFDRLNLKCSTVSYTKKIFHLAYCFRTIAYLFYSLFLRSIVLSILFSKKLNVSVSFKVVSYMRDSKAAVAVQKLMILRHQPNENEVTKKALEARRQRRRTYTMRDRDRVYRSRCACGTGLSVQGLQWEIPTIGKVPMINISSDKRVKESSRGFYSYKADTNFQIVVAGLFT